MKLCPVLLLSASLAGVWAVGAQGLPAPAIQARTAYTFDTVEGAAYLIEGTVNGEDWVTVAGPIFGDGTKAQAMLPAEAAEYGQLRVRPVSAASYEPATTALGGKTIALNDNGKVRQLVLFASSQGVTRGMLKTDAQHARSVVWKARRISASQVSVALQFFDGTTSTVDLKFSNGQLGTYQMRDLSGSGQLQVMEAGSFSTHVGRMRDNPSQAALPSALVGQTIGFEEAGDLTRMFFASGTNVVVTKPDGTTEVGKYTYDITSPVIASLNIETPGQAGQNYQLEPEIPGAGGFNRTPMIGGAPAPNTPPQPGNFNIPSGPVVPNSATGPPRSLEGRVLEMGGSNPVTLTFNEDGTGTATREDGGSVEVTPFTYDYAPTGEDEASLAITYPGADTDRVEDYDLDFNGANGGSFEGSIYEGGELSQSSSGNFNTGAG